MFRIYFIRTFYVGAYTGYACELLSSCRQEKEDEEELLNLVAKCAILGDGFDERRQNGYNVGGEVEWRVIL